MADPSFRERQFLDRYADHVRPVNQLVDELRGHDGRGWMPCVAPLHGGVEARVLSILRDPGPGTQEEGGSGFLCIENDDPTAVAQAERFECVNVKPHDITPWNAYPWYINRAPTAAELTAGVTPLHRLLQLLPDLRVVLLQGRHAQRGWELAMRRYPDFLRDRPDLPVVPTFHPGPKALFHPDREVREARKAHRRAAYETVAAHLADGSV
ncbi:uracil-DNA glycosylase [Kineosporiaceae bacterium B12]|nr:uracil-DNA glycosylase [Kineococcus rubinsiae]